MTQEELQALVDWHYAKLYTLTEAVNMELADIQDLHDKYGAAEPKQRCKWGLNKIVQGGKIFGEFLRKEKVGQQEAVGDVSDIILSYVDIIFDRCRSNSDMWYLYNHIKMKFPSKRNFNLNPGESRAFGLILKELKV